MCRDVQRWSRAELGSQHGMCQQPWRHSQQGRAEAGRAGHLLPARRGKWIRNSWCQVSSTCLLHCVWLFHTFLPFQAVTVQQTARLWKNQFGKELRSLSTLQFNSEREISLESVWICCFGGLYLQTLPVVLSDCPTPHVLVPVLGLLGWVSSLQALDCQIQETSRLSFGSIGCKFRKVLLCLPAYRNFTCSHILQTLS